MENITVMLHNKKDQSLDIIADVVSIEFKVESNQRIVHFVHPSGSYQMAFVSDVESVKFVI